MTPRLTSAAVERLHARILDCPPTGTSIATGRVVRAKTAIVSQGVPLSGLILLVEGWAARSRTLAGGRRQILDFCLPGDLCDINIFHRPLADATVSALTRVKLIELDAAACSELAAREPAMRSAMYDLICATQVRQRERAVTLGKRSAMERVAHLLCELFGRLRAVNWVYGDTCSLPLTQGEIGDALGLTSIHVNRVLQRLRADGLIELNYRELALPAIQRLREVALWDESGLAT